MMRRILALLAGFCRLCIKAIVIAIGCVMLLFIGTYLRIYAHFDGNASLPADCGIVFGAAVYGQNLPGPAITRRIAAAAELWREGSVRTLIVSGGKGSGVRESEADVMRMLAMELGVAGDSIIIEDQSHSTWENIEHSRNLTEGCSSVVGISDQYHLARIQLLARRQGWDDLQTFPAYDRPPIESERRSMYREVLAYIYYLFHIDRIFPDLPARAS